MNDSNLSHWPFRVFLTFLMSSSCNSSTNLRVLVVVFCKLGLWLGSHKFFVHENVLFDVMSKKKFGFRKNYFRRKLGTFRLSEKYYFFAFCERPKFCEKLVTVVGETFTFCKGVFFAQTFAKKLLCAANSLFVITSFHVFARLCLCLVSLNRGSSD